MKTLSIVLTCGLWLSGQEPAPRPEAKKATPAPAADKTLSDAERIARLQRGIEGDQKELQALKERLENPTGEFFRTQAEFQKLDSEVNSKKQLLEELLATGNGEDAAELQFHVETLTGEWTLLRERFNIAIQERKTFQHKMTALGDKILQAQQTLDQLTGRVAPATHAEKKVEPRSDDKKPAATVEVPPTASPTTPGAPTAATTTVSTPTQAAPKVESKELQKAKQVAEAKQVAAEQAVEKVQGLNERLETLRTNIKLDQNLLNSARKKLDNIQRTIDALEKEHNQQLATATRDELEQRFRKISEERARSEGARLDVRNITNHLNNLQEELMNLQAEQIDALREAERSRVEAESARRHVAELQNPYTVHNILQWLLHNGPKVLVVIGGMLTLQRVVRIGSHRIVEIITRSRFRKGVRELENRAHTLAGVFRNVSSMVIWGGGTLMLLDMIYVPVVPLLGGAAVVGLAVAFGAQNLIRDYFSGFMILVEDQYAVNDVVAIGDVSGQVERISLRTTVVRDASGNLHFIPHGTINGVSNMTHGWSRAVFLVGIAYNEKPERVMEVIKQLGRELRRDVEFGPMILEDLEMLGVDSFEESAIAIKFLIKTRPLKQWAVKREFLRRMKTRFDEVGIEFPFPTRTILHRNVDAEMEEAQAA